MKYIFNEKSDNYPIVIIPEKILGSFDYELSNEDVCEILNITYPILSYKKNSLNEPSEYRRVEKQKTKIKGDGCFLILGLPTLIFCVAMIIGGFQSNNPIVSLIFIVCLFVLLGGLGVNMKTETYFDREKIDKKVYDDLYEKFQNESYETTIENNKRKENYLQQKNKIDLVIKNNIETAKKIFHENKMKPEVGLRQIKTNSRGKTELYFLDKLFTKFGNQIYIDVAPDEGTNPYQPDFVFVCKETNLHIDIEIDEPYSVEYGKNIHHERTNDSERNSYFENINWIVIRFSEKQIIENSSACCDLIENIVENLKRKSYEYAHEVKLDKRWTYEESLIMSNNNYRNSYLPDNMKVTIKRRTNIREFDDDLPF